MNRKGKHLNKFLQDDQLPTPDVSADAAWHRMDHLLNVAGGIGGKGSGNAGTGDGGAGSSASGSGASGSGATGPGATGLGASGASGASAGAGGAGSLSAASTGAAKWSALIWKSLGTIKGMALATAVVVATSTVVCISVFNSDNPKEKTARTLTHPAFHKTHDIQPADTISEKSRLAVDNPVTDERIPKNKSDIAKRNSEAAPMRANSPDDKTRTDEFSAPNNRKPTANSPRTLTKDVEKRVDKADDRIATGTGRSLNRSGATSKRNISDGNAAMPISAADPGSPVIVQAKSDVKSSENPRIHSLKTLTSRPATFNKPANHLTVQPPAPETHHRTQKSHKPVFESIHFGPEWSLRFMDINSPYLLTGADSIKRPARLAIPGVFITKTWNRHAVTFIFTPTHSYFGNNDLVSRQTDTTRVADSIFTVRQHNVHFYKAIGMNFALQYQFETTSWLSLAAGVSYSTFSGALFRRDLLTSTGAVVNGELLSAKSREAMSGLIHPNQWAVRAGIIMHPGALWNGRLQIGSTAIIPVSTLTPYADRPKKWLNAQIFLRLLIK